MESLILWKEQGFSGKGEQFSLSCRSSGVEHTGNVPVVVRGWGDQEPVHGPVVILTEGEAIGRVVVGGDVEGDEVGGVDEADVVSGGEFDAEAAGGALVVVDFQDLAAKGGGAADLGFVFGDALGLWIGD